MMASLPRLANSTTVAGPDTAKCSAKAEGSEPPARSGLSSKTNSKGRLAVADVIGGVSHRKAGKGDSASWLMKNWRNRASLRQEAITCAYEIGDALMSIVHLSARPFNKSVVRDDHMQAFAAQRPLSEAAKSRHGYCLCNERYG